MGCKVHWTRVIMATCRSTETSTKSSDNRGREALWEALDGHYLARWTLTTSFRRRGKTWKLMPSRTRQDHLLLERVWTDVLQLTWNNILLLEITKALCIRYPTNISDLMRMWRQEAASHGGNARPKSNLSCQLRLWLLSSRTGHLSKSAVLRISTLLVWKLPAEWAEAKRASFQDDPPSWMT